MNRYLSPLRYPGGKAKLANFVKLLLRTNRLCDAHYVEPYAGGASVALALLMGEYVTQVHINDLDRSVFAFWHSVLNETEALCQRIRDTRLSVAEWRRQRVIQRCGDQVGLLELGFSTLFLNRTNRSGIIASGGVIGGVAQDGEWKLDVRFPRAGLVARIEAIASYRDRISLYNADAGALLTHVLTKLPRKSILYLDPPYYVKGRRRLYANAYEHAGHARIASILAGVRQPWVVSYDDVPQIRALYSRYRHRAYGVSYSARRRCRGEEVMFFSDDLILPAVRSPVAVSERRVNQRFAHRSNSA